MNLEVVSLVLFSLRLGAKWEFLVLKSVAITRTASVLTKVEFKSISPSGSVIVIFCYRNSK